MTRSDERQNKAVTEEQLQSIWNHVQDPDPRDDPQWGDRTMHCVLLKLFEIREAFNVRTSQLTDALGRVRELEEVVDAPLEPEKCRCGRMLELACSRCDGGG